MPTRPPPKFTPPLCARHMADAEPTLQTMRRGASAARVLIILAACAAAPAQAGRTDRDWMTPSESSPLVDAPTALERLGTGAIQRPDRLGQRPANSGVAAEMHVATRQEARAFMQDPGASDGAGILISALLDRLREPMVRPALAPAIVGIEQTDLDCALFEHGLRVRQVLGARRDTVPGEGGTRSGAVGLDVPIRCLAAAPRPTSLPPRLQALVAQADASSMPMDSRSPGANAPSSWPVDQWISTSSGAALLVLGVTVWIATVRKRRAARKAGEHKLSW